MRHPVDSASPTSSRPVALWRAEPSAAVTRNAATFARRGRRRQNGRTVGRRTFAEAQEQNDESLFRGGGVVVVVDARERFSEIDSASLRARREDAITCENHRLDGDGGRGGVPSSGAECCRARRRERHLEYSVRDETGDSNRRRSRTFGGGGGGSERAPRRGGESLRGVHGAPRGGADHSWECAGTHEEVDGVGDAGEAVEGRHEFAERDEFLGLDGSIAASVVHPARDGVVAVHAAGHLFESGARGGTLGGAEERLADASSSRPLGDGEVEHVGDVLAAQSHLRRFEPILHEDPHHPDHLARFERILGGLRDECQLLSGGRHHSLARVTRQRRGAHLRGVGRVHQDFDHRGEVVGAHTPHRHRGPDIAVRRRDASRRSPNIASTPRHARARRTKRQRTTTHPRVRATGCDSRR